VKWILALELAMLTSLPIYFFSSTKQASPCAGRYSPLHHGSEAEIRVVFGYKDSRPLRYVGDRYERIAYAQELIRIGFQNDPEDADLFTLQSQSRKWKVRLVHSSVGPDDDANRKDGFQTWQAAYAHRVFHEGLGKGGMVLYNGHSRDGGGPDFAPPRITPSRHIDYYYYRVQTPGLKSLVKALTAAKQPAAVLGLFSCQADTLFSEAIHQAQSEIALVSTEALIYEFDAMKNMEGLVKAVVGDYCRPAFDSAIEAESKGGKTKVDGFLAKD